MLGLVMSANVAGKGETTDYGERARYIFACEEGGGGMNASTAHVSQVSGALPEQYRVESRSTPGTFHTVRFHGSGDGDPDYVRLWDCDCPAYRFRGSCSHIRAVSDWLDEEAEE